MYVLTRAVNKTEFIFYLMDSGGRPLKAKIEKTFLGRAIELTRMFAKENNTDIWEINTDKGREIVD
jgi:hypothetical protein